MATAQTSASLRQTDTGKRGLVVWRDWIKSSDKLLVCVIYGPAAIYKINNTQEHLRRKTPGNELVDLEAVPGMGEEPRVSK